MPESDLERQLPTRPAEEISVLSLANVLLRRRRLIFWLSVVGATVGLLLGLRANRLYVSSATFLPQGAEATTGLAAAASQLIGQAPPSVGGWSPAVYVELLSAPTFLESILKDSLVVTEQHGRNVDFATLMEIEAPTPALRSAAAIRVLASMVKATDVRALGVVKVTVATPWPSVSLALAERMVNGVNQFNLKIRNSQAAAERQFVEGQAEAARRNLDDAEDQLKLFLQRNAAGNAPELLFERDRLSRSVSVRQQMYLSLLQDEETARIREVRDTPVITVLESPRLPVVGEPRGSLSKAMLGGISGLVLGALIAFAAHAIAAMRRWPGSDVQEFFRLIREATPRFLKRKKSA